MYLCSQPLVGKCIEHDALCMPQVAALATQAAPPKSGADAAVGNGGSAGMEAEDSAGEASVQSEGTSWVNGHSREMGRREEVRTSRPVRSRPRPAQSASLEWDADIPHVPNGVAHGSDSATSPSPDMGRARPVPVPHEPRRVYGHGKGFRHAEGDAGRVGYGGPRGESRDGGGFDSSGPERQLSRPHPQHPDSERRKPLLTTMHKSVPLGRATSQEAPQAPATLPLLSMRQVSVPRTGPNSLPAHLASRATSVATDLSTASVPDGAACARQSQVSGPPRLSAEPSRAPAPARMAPSSQTAQNQPHCESVQPMPAPKSMPALPTPCQPDDEPPLKPVVQVVQFGQMVPIPPTLSLLNLPGGSAPPRQHASPPPPSNTPPPVPQTPTTSGPGAAEHCGDVPALREVSHGPQRMPAPEQVVAGLPGSPSWSHGQAQVGMPGEAAHSSGALHIGTMAPPHVLHSSEGHAMPGHYSHNPNGPIMVPLPPPPHSPHQARHLQGTMTPPLPRRHSFGAQPGPPHTPMAMPSHLKTSTGPGPPGIVHHPGHGPMPSAGVPGLGPAQFNYVSGSMPPAPRSPPAVGHSMPPYMHGPSHAVPHVQPMGPVAGTGTPSGPPGGPSMYLNAGPPPPYMMTAPGQPQQGGAGVLPYPLHPPYGHPVNGTMQPHLLALNAYPSPVPGHMGERVPGQGLPAPRTMLRASATPFVPGMKRKPSEPAPATQSSPSAVAKPGHKAPLGSTAEGQAAIAPTQALPAVADAMHHRPQSGADHGPQDAIPNGPIFNAEPGIPLCLGRSERVAEAVEPVPTPAAKEADHASQARFLRPADHSSVLMAESRVLIMLRRRRF